MNRTQIISLSITIISVIYIFYMDREKQKKINLIHTRLNTLENVINRIIYGERLYQKTEETQNISQETQNISQEQYNHYETLDTDYIDQALETLNEDNNEEQIEEDPVGEQVEEYPVGEQVEEEPVGEQVEEEPVGEQIEEASVEEEVEEASVEEEVEEQDEEVREQDTELINNTGNIETITINNNNVELVKDPLDTELKEEFDKFFEQQNILINNEEPIEIIPHSLNEIKDMNVETLKGMKVTELKELARNYNIKIKGNKQTIIDTILNTIYS